MKLDSAYFVLAFILLCVLSSAQAQTAFTSSTLTITHHVISGDSLDRISKKNGLSQENYARLLRASKKDKSLSRLMPGQELHIHFNANKQIVKLTHSIDKIQKTAYVFDKDETISVIDESRVINIRHETVAGKIKASLFDDGKTLGLSDRILMQMLNIFKRKTNFGDKPRKGDYFAAVFEAKYLDDERLDTGNLLAVEFARGDKYHQVIRFTHKNKNNNTEIIDPENPVKKPIIKKTTAKKARFLRYPLRFTRVSSKFALRRLHPIYKRWRPHKGVDFAAPKGRSVWATGDGKVEFIGRQRGYGRVIFIKHNSKYTTVYAHLSGFKSGLRKGAKVKRREVIGYVGKSGHATGYHLHYEFRINGKHVDPLKMRLPVHSRPVKTQVVQKPTNTYKSKAFKKFAKPLLEKLDQLKSG